MKNGFNYGTQFVMALLLTLLCTAHSFSQQVRFTNLSTKEGLSHHTAYGIIQHQQGEIYIASQNGLNSYNGYDFTHYYADAADSAALTNDNLGSLVEDSQGNIWIGTWGGGINKFNPHTKKFTHFLHQRNDPTSISDDRIQTIVYDSLQQAIWAGTFSGGLNRIDLATNQVTHFQTKGKQSQGINNNRVWAIHQISKHEFWIGTDKGLNKFNSATNTFKHYYLAEEDLENIAKNRVRSIFQMQDGRLYIGAQEGLYQFDPKTGQFNYLAIQKKWHQQAELSVTSFYEYPKGTLWIGTQRNGLIQYQPKVETYTQYLSHPLDLHSIGGNDIRDITVDASGVFWVAIRRGGISKFSLDDYKFTHHRYNPEQKNGLSDPQILSIMQDHEKSIWVGTLLGGVNKMNKDGNFSYYTPNTSQQVGLMAPEVRHILQLKDRSIWLAVDRTLQRYNPNTNEFTVFKLPEQFDQSTSDDRLTILLENADGNIWVGTRENGLLLFHRDEQRFERMPNPHSKKYANVINDIVHASDVYLWVGTEAGLYRFNKRTKKYQFIRSASNHSIYDMTHGLNGMLWLGTSNGLLKFSTKTAKVSIYNKRSGLPVNQINSLTSDTEGFLWIGTTRGLSRFDPITETFRNYDLEDGLQGNIFSQRASFKCPDGELIIAGRNGFNRFYPTQLQPNAHAPQVILTAFSKMGKKLSFPTALQDMKRIELSHEDFLFSFEFAALDYHAPHKNQYAYRLIGMDNDWVTIGNRRQVNFNKVPPGTYTFQVKASNNDNIWNETGTSIQVIIHPPYWKTWWFYTLIFLVLVGLSILSFYWRIKNLNQARKLLEYTVAHRTNELREERDKLKEANTRISIQIEEIESQRDEIEAQRNDIGGKNETLQQALDEIQWQNREIKSQKEEIEHKSKDLEYAQSLIKEQNIQLIGTNQALEDKVQQRTAELKRAYRDLLRAHKQLDHFSYRSAHDLKGPIARLVGLCYVARLEITEEKALYYFDKLEITAKEMDELLGRMMRTQEIKNWRIQLTEIDLKQLILEEWASTCKQEKVKGFALDYTVSGAFHRLDADVDLLKILFHNLFENAIRFRNTNELKPKVKVTIDLNNQDQAVITIQDNGLGVPKNMTSKIFEMFVVGNDFSKSAGIGLYEGSLIAERLHGKLWLKEYQRGNTTFELILPLSQHTNAEYDSSFVIKD